MESLSNLYECSDHSEQSEHSSGSEEHTRTHPPPSPLIGTFGKVQASSPDSFWSYSGATVQPGVDEGLFGEIGICLSPAACWARAVDPSAQLYTCFNFGKIFGIFGIFFFWKINKKMKIRNSKKSRSRKSKMFPKNEQFSRLRFLEFQNSFFCVNFERLLLCAFVF